MKDVLQFGSLGAEVAAAQRSLLNLGYDLGPRGADGVLGVLTRSALRAYQRKHSLPVTGDLDSQTRQQLVLRGLVAERFAPEQTAEQVLPQTAGADRYAGVFTLSSLQLVLDFEVGGGREYYEAHLSRPCLPPEESGCTVGIGVDLRFTSMEDFVRMFYPLRHNGTLTPGQVGRLERVLGFRPSQAEVAKLHDIVIPYDEALKIFLNFTVPRFWKITMAVFPGVELLPLPAMVAMLSLVFNRGGGVQGARRREMDLLQDVAIPRHDLRMIADLLKSMKRLWPNTWGLRRRRDAEAALVLSALNPFPQ